MSSTPFSTPIAARAAKRLPLSSVLEWGGVVAGAILIAFGVVAIVMGVNGRSTVHSSLRAEQIVGTPDMTPAAIKTEAAQAGLKAVSLPSKSVAGKPITSGDRA